MTDNELLTQIAAGLDGLNAYNDLQRDALQMGINFLSVIARILGWVIGFYLWQTVLEAVSKPKIFG